MIMATTTGTVTATATHMLTTTNAYRKVRVSHPTTITMVATIP
jgi:hypothetical protein